MKTIVVGYDDTEAAKHLGRCLRRLAHILVRQLQDIGRQAHAQPADAPAQRGHVVLRWHLRGSGISRVVARQRRQQVRHILRRTPHRSRMVQ